MALEEFNEIPQQGRHNSSDTSVVYEWRSYQDAFDVSCILELYPDSGVFAVAHLEGTHHAGGGDASLQTDGEGVTLHRDHTSRSATF